MLRHDVEVAVRGRGRDQPLSSGRGALGEDDGGGGVAMRPKVRQQRPGISRNGRAVHVPVTVDDDQAGVELSEVLVPEDGNWV